MKKLSEYRDGEAIDLMADMLEPLVSMTKNKEFMEKINDRNTTGLEKVQFTLKACKEEVITILAILNGVPREEYHCSIASILVDLTKLMSDRDFIAFFESQGQKTSDTTFGSATENTGVVVQ